MNQPASQPDGPPDGTPPPDVPGRAGLLLLEALAIGIIGAGLLAAVEVGGVAFMSRARFTEGWPWGLIVAGFGKAGLTHLLVWTPLLMLLGLLLCRGRHAARPQRLAVLVGIYFALSLPVVIVADLMMLNRDAPAYLVGGAVFGLVFAALAWLVQARVTPRLSSTLVAASLWIKTGVFGLALLGGLIALLGSPFWNAAGYRVAEAVPQGSAGPRNVLWIVLDTVRADRLGVYGYPRPTTPELAARAAQLRIYERAVTPGIWTVPGHASMFTGLSTREHGADLPGRWLDDEKQTIAERLREDGYATAGFCNNPWIAPHTNLSRGFDYYLTLNHYRHLGRFSLEYLLDVFGLTPPVPWLDGDYGAAATNSLVRDWLADRPGDQPFFVFVNYMEAHAPYRVPRPLRAAFMEPDEVARSYALRKSAFGEIADVLHYRINIEGAPFLSDRDRDILADQYDAALRYLDLRVAELLDLLESSALLDETLVIITGDHGEYLDEHGMWAHTFLAYEGVTRVPLLLRVPGGAGARIDEVTRLADLFPTVLHHATGTPQSGPGHDVRDLLAERGDEVDPRYAITRWSGAEPKLQKRIDALDDPEVKHRGRGQTAIQDGTWKLLVSDDGRRELYHLPSDPGERTNLIDTKPDEAERLAAALAAYEQAVPPYRSSRGAGAADAATLRDLEALGYAGGDDEEDGDED